MLGLTRAFGALYLTSLLMQLGSTLLMTWLALRVAAGGLAEFWGGALMAANALGMVLGWKFGQALIGRLGHVRAYVACAGVICAAVLAHAFSDALPLWLALRALVGVAWMCQLMVVESWLNDAARSDQRGKVLGIYMVAVYVGMILGQLALSIDSSLGIHALLGVVIAFVLSQVPLALTRSPHPAPPSPAPIDLRLFLRQVPQALLTTLASGMLNGGFYGLAAIYASQQGLSTSQVGLFMALTIGAGLLAQIPLGLLSDRVPRAVLIRAVALLLMLACLPLVLLHGLSFAALLLCSALIGSLQFCLYPLGVALGNDRVEPEQRVSLAGMLLLTFSVGACGGPLVAGLLMESFGPASLYAFFAGCAALLGLLVSPCRVAAGPLRGEEPLPLQASPNGVARAIAVSGCRAGGCSATAPDERREGVTAEIVTPAKEVG